MRAVDCDVFNCDKLDVLLMPVPTTSSVLRNHLTSLPVLCHSIWHHLSIVVLSRFFPNSMPYSLMPILSMEVMQCMCQTRLNACRSIYAILYIMIARFG